MAEIPIRSFGVSVVLLRNVGPETEVLLLRRNQTLVGEWCQIAGGIEDGEKAWETALRQVKGNGLKLRPPLFSGHMRTVL